MTCPPSLRTIVLFLIAVQPARGAEESPQVNPPRPTITQGNRQISGIYPHLAVFNNENECGIGALVPWADRLWLVTYAPHRPQGSTDKLYEITDDLTMAIRPESIGGTPANRMIHRESRQLFIGPYAIGEDRNVRAIPYERMYGRPTGNARHLTDPADKIYYATMEEGFYEVDVETLQVTELWRDEQLKEGRHSQLPGYHGKGLYSGQGRIIYANNGEHGSEAQARPDVASGALATWDGQADEWTVVRRNQFTEVTGPGGLFGNEDPESDPVWSIGWDHRSLILALLDDGEWSYYRLPKSSHSYDGAHGWNTEWPRIRDIGEDDLLMTMHGMFWRFPQTFREGHTAGIAPRSSYLKVVGDFCRWNDYVILGCDDAARAEFLNTRKAKGHVAGPAYSQSNLWFLNPEQLDALGPARGRGAVWLDEKVAANQPSDPFLFNGFDQRGVHLAHHSDEPVSIRFEIDRQGNGQWSALETVTVPASGYLWHSFPSDEQGAWIRAIADADCQATVWFEYRNKSQHPATVNNARAAPTESAFQMNALIDSSHLAPQDEPSAEQTPNNHQCSDPARSRHASPLGTPDRKASELTGGLARIDAPESLGGLVRAGAPMTGLQLLATKRTGTNSAATGYYELKPGLTLVRVDSSEKRHFMEEKVAIPTDVLKIEGHSVLYIADDGQRYRLPIGNFVYMEHPELLNQQRTSREATTERDLFQAAGTFFELPARNAGGFAKIMPIATHPYYIQDYCSWRGLLALTGTDAPADGTNSHIIRSDDDQAAVWLGTIDDLWKFGKPLGTGGPWHDSQVAANEPSDPYLMAGYDQKDVTISHESEETVAFEIQVDITGTGLWQTYMMIDVPAGESVSHEFPKGFQAYWVRFVANRPAVATAMLRYE